jgi:hypothetical protein
MNHPELDFDGARNSFRPAAPAPTEVEILTTYLLNNPGFHTAAQLAKALAYTDRKIRQLAEASDSYIISGPGSPGYIHINHCPAEKLAHIPETLISQGKSMIRRGIRIKRRAHSIIR